ncbi:MAG: hypothetical protein LAO21_02790 [Acidobacteriia bacterium]|nr:hypothetical protein [Terriglobia bacterium]
MTASLLRAQQHRERRRDLRFLYLEMPRRICRQLVDDLAGFFFGCHGLEATGHNSIGELLTLNQ